MKGDVNKIKKIIWQTIKGNSTRTVNIHLISNTDWVSYFETFFSSQEPQMQIDNRHPHHNITQNNDTASLDLHITEAEIRHAINKLKSDLCGGPDGT